MFAQLGFGIWQCGFLAGDGVLSYYILLSLSGLSYSHTFLLPLVLLNTFPNTAECICTHRLNIAVVFGPNCRTFPAPGKQQ